MPTVSLNANKVTERNFAPDPGQKAIPVYADKFNDLIDVVEDASNLLYTTTGTQASGLTITEYSSAETYHRTVLEGTFFAASDVLTAAALPGAGSPRAFGKKIFDFPEGGVRVEAAVMDLTLVASLSSTAAEIGLGTTLATGATASLGGAGATTENIIDGSTAGATSNTSGSGGGTYQRVAAAETDAAALDGAGTAVDMYLNIAAGWDETGTYIVAGTISFNWSYLGDY